MEKFYYYTTVILFAVIGLCVGSFLNVVIARLPNSINLAFPPSRCPKCKSQIKWYDNIPLLSFIILGGKCRNCKQNISFEYFFIELLNFFTWLVIAVLFYNNGIIYIASACVFVSALICIALIDEKHLFIPDSLQIVILVSALVNLIINFSNANYFVNGLLISCGFFLFFYFISFALFKREGMGFGDVKLMAIAGLMLGVKSICVSILISVLLALLGIAIKRSAVTNAKLPLNKESLEEFAFAPYLCLGIIFSLFFGDIIADSYISILLI